MQEDFNPHSHKGSDRFWAMLKIGFTYFNPHSHKGSDVEWNGAMPTVFYFNPHSHKGSDFYDCILESYKEISIHTPTRGVTVLLFWHCKN